MFFVISGSEGSFSLCISPFPVPKGCFSRVCSPFPAPKGSFSCAFSQFLSPKGRFPSVFRNFRPQRVVFLVFLLILRPRRIRGSSFIFSENLAWIFQPRSLDIFFFQKRYFSCLDAQGPLKPKTGLLAPAPKGRFPRVFRTFGPRRVVFRCFSPCPAQKWRKT